MEESDETKRLNFFKIIIFLVDIATQVYRNYLKHKLSPDQDLYDFLFIHRHALYHKWLYNTPCCSSNCEIEAKPLKKPEICLMHFETMYNINGPEKDGHEQRKDGKVLQHCFCKVSVKSGVYLGALDLTTCYRLLSNFIIISPQEKVWLKGIIKQRNAINKHLNDKKLAHDLYKTMWEQLELAVLCMSAEIDKSYSDEIQGQLKTLTKTTPTMKKYIRCYETYLEWFSRDDILRQEVKNAKFQFQQREPLASLLPIPAKGNNQMLEIIETIIVNLLKNTDGVPTAVERLTAYGIEHKEDKQEHEQVYTEKENSISIDIGTSGGNTSSQLMTDVSIKDTMSGDVNGESSEVKKFYEANIILDIPGKTRWQNTEIVNKVERYINQVKYQLIRINSVSIDQNSIVIIAEMSAIVFQTRKSLRDSLTILLQMIFQLCGISDCFHVDVTIRVFNSDNIDVTQFNTNDDVTATDPDRIRKFAAELSFSPVPEKTKQCADCRVKDQEIFNLHKQVKTLKATKHPPRAPKCKECLLKDKKIFLLQQEQLKIENENAQKNILISSLRSDLGSKDIIITTYKKLERTHSILEKQISIWNQPEQKEIPRLKHPNSMFLTRPISEPPNVLNRFSCLTKTHGQHGPTKRPISEQVLKKSRLPSVFKTQQKYLSSIRRKADFVPIGKMAVLRYSYSDSKCKGPFKIPAFPPLMSLKTSTTLIQRPVSVRGKHLIVENVDSTKNSKIYEREDWRTNEYGENLVNLLYNVVTQMHDVVFGTV